MEITSNSLAKTRKIGEILAKESLKSNLKNALIFALNGELGSGKTSFVQGFARGLGIRIRVLSPTFNIFKRFNIKGSKSFKNFYHFDCYRIARSREIKDLGFDEIIKDSKNIVIIEWADKIKRILPRDKIKIDFHVVDEKTRLFSIESKS